MSAGAHRTIDPKVAPFPSFPTRLHQLLPCVNQLYSSNRWVTLSFLPGTAGIGSAATSDGGEEIDADRSQIRWWELGLVARVGLQSGFASAIEKDRQLHQVLIRESVRAVVSHGRRFVQVRSCELGRQGVQLQNQQAESADVRGPAA